jgi:hypothetical protein
MAALLCNRWFTTVRVLIYGALCAYIFSVSPREIPSAEIVGIAVLGCLCGVILGFWLARRPALIHVLSKVGGHHYSLVAMAGFVFAALWATETSIVWPLLVWFVPAGVLEAFVSRMGLARRQRAS